MGLGMFQNSGSARPDNKAVPAPPSAVSRGNTIRDLVNEAQVKLGKAAPKIAVNVPKKTNENPGLASKSLLGA